MSTANVARWEIESLQRSRRGIDEGLVLAAPWSLRFLFALAAWGRPGSPPRRALLGHVVRVGLAANNRDDYVALSAFVSPDVELYVMPDAPHDRVADMDAVYRGRDGYLAANKLWKEGFGEFRWEPRELLDPGRDLIAARIELIGRGSASGVETRMMQFHVWQFDHGQVRRQWGLQTESAAMEVLRREPAAQPPAPATRQSV